MRKDEGMGNGKFGSNCRLVNYGNEPMNGSITNTLKPSGVEGCLGPLLSATWWNDGMVPFDLLGLKWI